MKKAVMRRWKIRDLTLAVAKRLSPALQALGEQYSGYDCSLGRGLSNAHSVLSQEGRMVLEAKAFVRTAHDRARARLAEALSAWSYWLSSHYMFVHWEPCSVAPDHVYPLECGLKM
jgi:hypothetical protein